MEQFKLWGGINLGVLSLTVLLIAAVIVLIVLMYPRLASPILQAFRMINWFLCTDCTCISKADRGMLFTSIQIIETNFIKSSVMPYISEPDCSHRH